MNILKQYSNEELLALSNADIEKELKERGYEYGWHKKTTYAGEIYILVNPAFIDLVKIGYADDVEKRVKTLNRNSGLPDPFHVYATYKVKKRLEDLKLHKLIDSLDSDLRHAKNKEFYEMSPEKAYGILAAIAEINGDEDLLTFNPINDPFFRPEGKPKQKGPITRDIAIPDGTYYFSRKKKSDNRTVQATAITKNGEWTILKGAILGITEDAGINQKAKEVRNQLKVNNNRELLEDFYFGKCTPSFVGTVLMNQACNGWLYFKAEDGTLIDIYRNQQQE